MRICSGAGCLRAVADDVSFCDECKPHVADADGIRVHSLGYDAEIDRLNKGLRWQRLRALIVRRDPICKRCDREMTAIIDHIVPAKVVIAQARVSGKWPGDRYAGYYLSSNLQGLCRLCHAAKTNEDKTHVGPWPDAVERAANAPKKVWTF